MSLLSIRSEIITLMENIKLAAGFNAVYYDVPTSISVTPAVAVILSGFYETMETNAGNTLNSTFTVRVMVEKKEDDLNDVVQTSKLLDITDSVLAELRKKDNTLLNGEAYSLMSTSGSQLLVGEIEQMKVFYINIDVEVKQYNSIC